MLINCTVIFLETKTVIDLLQICVCKILLIVNKLINVLRR